MSEVYVSSLGAVSPAGWGLGAMRDALAKGEALASTEMAIPNRAVPSRVMRVPAPVPRPSFLGHARLRRTSPITQFAVAAAVEALGTGDSQQRGRIGVIVCVFSGCVNYSRRFYDETLKDPATASPLIFPETVFNAPASHISAYLGSTAINYTLVGDAGTFLVGLATGARWLMQDMVDACLVVGTEEIDWLTSQAVRLFDRKKALSEGAGAVLLKKEGAVKLAAITDEHLYGTAGKKAALLEMKRELGAISSETLLVDSTGGETGISKDEAELWRGMEQGRRSSPRVILGEGLMAGAAWQVVAAVDALMNQNFRESCVSIAGFHQHAVGARFARV